jgi:hypothetical protein
MRVLVPIFILTIFSCIQNTANKRTMTSCQDGTQEAIEDFKAGKILFIRNGFMPRYDSVLSVLLYSNRIKYSFDMFGHFYRDCYPSTMDSLITEKFGDNFVDKLELVADSLFFEERKNITFEYYEVDTWPMRKNSDDHLGGDFVINYLNEKLTPKSSFRFVSNIVDRPNYLIVFTVDKDGQTRNVEIVERNEIGKFQGTEELIVKEVAKIKEWTPATIRNQPVTAKFQMGVAIESGE